MKNLMYSVILIAAIVFATACNSNKKGNNDNFFENTIINAKGDTLHTIFDNENELVTIFYKGDTAILYQQPSASGINYKNDTYEYIEWQGEIELIKQGDGTIFSNRETENPTDSIDS